MSGLSYFDDGGSTTTPQEEKTSVMAKPVTYSRGILAGLPVPKGDVPISEGVLSAMEQMYMDRLAQQGGFMEAMKDAAAWWSGDIAGPSAALARRSEEREKQSANLFQLQAAIAQNKAAQEEQEKFQKDKSALLGLGKDTAKASGADLLPHEIEALGRTRTRADFDKLFNSFMTERTKGLTQPGAAELKYDVQIINPDGTVTYNTVDLRTKEKLRREGRLYEPGMELKPAPAAPTTPAPAAPTTPAPAAPTTPAPAAPTTPAPATKPVNYTFDELSEDQKNVLRAKLGKEGLMRDVFSRPDSAELFNKYTLEERKKLFDVAGPSESVQPVKLASATTGTMTDVTEPTTGPITEPTQLAQAPKAIQRPLTVPEQRAQLKLQEQRNEAMVQAEKEDFASHDAANKLALPIKANATEAINLLEKDRTIAGFFQNPGTAAALGTLIKTGISAPGGHSIGIKELDDVLFKGQKNVSPEQIAARDRLRTILNQSAVFITPMYSKGQGAITEYERQLFAQLVGSLDNAPGNLIKIQKMLLAQAENRQNINSAFKASKMHWGEFKNTPEYQKIEQAHNERVMNIAKEPLSVGSGARPTAPQPFKDKEQQERYNKFKEEELRRRREGK